MSSLYSRVNIKEYISVVLSSLYSSQHKGIPFCCLVSSSLYSRVKIKEYLSVVLSRHLWYNCIFFNFIYYWGHRGRDRMVVGFTTYAISAYHHCCCEFESRSGRGVQHYLIKFVSDLGHVSGFLRVLRFPPPKKLTTTISLKYC